MENQQMTERSSKRLVRVAILALALGLLASLVPIAASQASALPRVDTSKATPVEISETNPVASSRAMQCALLLLELRLSGIDNIDTDHEPGSIIDTDPSDKDANNDAGTVDNETINSVDQTTLDLYRALGCYLLGFTDY